MITLTPIKLGYGLTPEDACFNFITGKTYYVCPAFTTKSGETIDYSIFEDSGGTITVASGFYSDGNIVRYYNSKDGAIIGALCEAYVCRKSEYLRGCCDNKVYKLKSGKSLPVDALISVKPVYFCYRVIPEPTVPLRFSILNDKSGYLIFPSNKTCDAPECQPCPTTTGTTINDCDPITLFPIEIKCDTVNPTEAAPLSGTLSAIVIGGTQPYFYTWTFPNGTQVNTQTINNVGAGIYNLVVVDRYGDFTGVTNCELTIYIDCTFSGSVTEFIPTTTTTTTLGPCLCYTIENNWNGDLVTTTTTVSTCPPYCIENITLTGNGISNVIILDYIDCNGQPAQVLFAPGNFETINTPDISSIILTWVSGVGTPNESVDYIITPGECPTPMMLIGDVYLNYYDCEVGMTSIIISTGITKVCSYTVPSVYPTVTGVTITQTGICQTEPCTTTSTIFVTTQATTTNITTTSTIFVTTQATTTTNITTTITTQFYTGRWSWENWGQWDNTPYQFELTVTTAYINGVQVGNCPNNTWPLYDSLNLGSPPSSITCTPPLNNLSQPMLYSSPTIIKLDFSWGQNTGYNNYQVRVEINLTWTAYPFTYGTPSITLPPLNILPTDQVTIIVQ